MHNIPKLKSSPAQFNQKKPSNLFLNPGSIKVKEEKKSEKGFRKKKRERPTPSPVHYCSSTTVVCIPLGFLTFTASTYEKSLCFAPSSSLRFREIRTRRRKGTPLIPRFQTSLFSCGARRTSSVPFIHVMLVGCICQWGGWVGCVQPGFLVLQKEGGREGWMEGYH